MVIAALIALAHPGKFTPAQKPPSIDAARKMLAAGDGKFVENKGQWKSDAKFAAMTGAVDMWVTNHGIVYNWHKPQEKKTQPNKKDFKAPERQGFTPKSERKVVKDANYAVSVDFVGASGKGQAVGNDQVPGIQNIYKGHRAARVHSFKSATIKDLYPGIDMVTYFDDEANRPRYDLVVHPGADPNQIRMKYTNAKNLTVTKDGAVEYEVGYGKVSETRQMAYQKGDQGVDYRFFPKQVMESDGTVGFDVTGYRKDRTLVIDPLVWSTFLPGAGQFFNDFLMGMQVDASGNVYVSGTATTADLPAVGAGTGTFNSSEFYDAYVAKFDVTGAAIYSSYFGGDGDDGDAIQPLAIDPAGNAAICGTTDSDDLPNTTNGNPVGQTYGFYAIFDGTGALVADNYLKAGAHLQVILSAISFSPVMSEFMLAGVAAGASSTAPLVTYGVTAAGVATSVQTVPGTDTTLIDGMSIDSSGNIFVLSDTASDTILSGGYQPMNANTLADFADTNFLVHKLTPDGTSVQAATYLGTYGTSAGTAIGVDSTGNPIIYGYIGADQESVGGVPVDPAYPTTGGAYSSVQPTDSFPVPMAVVSKLSNDLSSLLASTTFPANFYFVPAGMAVLPNGAVILTGLELGGMPTTWDYFSGRAGAGYVGVLDANLSSLLYGTYLGNDSNTNTLAVAFFGGALYVAGITSDPNYQVSGGAAYPTFPDGEQAAFVTVINPTVLPSLTRIATDRGNAPSMAGGVGKTLNVSVYFVEPPGTPITLTSSNPTVQVNGGASSTYIVTQSEHVATFPVTANDVASVTPVSLTADDGTNSLTPITLTVQPFIKSIVPRPTTLASGVTLPAMVYVYEVPQDDQIVAITTTPSFLLATFPTSVIISGLSSGGVSGPTPVNISLNPVDFATNATVTASLVSGASSASSAFTVSNPTFSSASFGPATIGVDTFSNLTLNLTGAVATPHIYNFTSGTPSLSPDTSVTIPAGASSGTSNIVIASEVFSASATLTNNYTSIINGVKRTVPLKVIPNTIQSLTVDNPSVAEGDTVNLLGAVAQPTIIQQILRAVSNYPGTTAPTIDALTTSSPTDTSFTAAVPTSFQALTAPRTVRLSMQWVGPGGVLAGPVKTVTFNVNPELTSITLPSASVKGGTTVTGSVNLFEAYTGAQQVSVSSNSSLVYFGTPTTQSTSFAVNTGSTTVPFTVNTKPVTKNTTVVLTFTSPLGYKTRTINLTLTP